MEIEAVGLTVELVPAYFEPLETFIDGIERGLRVSFGGWEQLQRIRSLLCRHFA